MSIIFHRNFVVFSAFVVVVYSVLFQEHLIYIYDYLISSYLRKSGVQSCINNEVVYSQKDLLKYNGIDKDLLYLALLGIVFDVTKGKQHYERGASYHYFVGKDGSRSFITGNFNDVTKDKDHVVDLPCEDLFALTDWKDNFSEKYTKVGILEGRYFDKNCQETKYSIQLTERLKECKLMKQKIKEQELEYPPCNMEWSVDEGTRVWCTKTSGGIMRDWAGVPRQFYTPGTEKPVCVCVNLDRNKYSGKFKEYENCSSESSSCIVK